MVLPAERINFLKVPIDIVPPEEFPAVISRLIPGMGDKDRIDKKNTHNIVLLSIWDLLKARRNNEYRKYVLNAALVIPISKSIIGGIKFLTGKNAERYMPFNFIISLLTALEQKEYPLYLLGGKNTVLRKAEKNINLTFPRLKIVGRYEGKMNKRTEPAVIEAIRKSSPSLLLAGRGIRKSELWIAKNEERLNTGLRLWCSDLFDVFAEKRSRPSDSLFEKGLESLSYTFRNPLLFFRIFPYLGYKILLLAKKLFK